MTLVRKQRKYDLYFDNVLVQSFDVKEIVLRFGDYVYFGGSPWYAGATWA